MKRIVALVALAVLALPAPAAAAPLCRVTGPDAAAAATLRDHLRVRRYFGFDVDPAYVRTLRTRASEYGDLPLTAREQRYLQRRAKLRLLTAARRALGGAYAGEVVKDAWPRAAYLLVHLTRDPPPASLPRGVRVDRVRYSVRDLDRIERRIMRHDRALRRAGFDIERTATNAETNRIDVELVTRRTDHATYFRKRYGPVHTVVIGTERTKLECAPARLYEIAPDGRGLTIHWTTGRDAKTEHIEVTELPDRVVIGVVERVPVGARLLQAIAASGTATLSAPLGARAVINGASGRRMIQHGPSPGDPPCPERPEPSELERAIEDRSDYGMRADPAYVQSLLAAGRVYTDAEQRYVDAARDLDPGGDLHEYVIHWRKEWGGTMLVARYPAKPYLLIRLTRRRAYHERNLKRLAGDRTQIRTVAAKHPVDEIYALEQRINADASAGYGFLDGYGRAGFLVLSASGHDQTAEVEVNVVTSRPDAQAYFTRRYGELAHVYLRGDRFECGTTPFF